MFYSTCGIKYIEMECGGEGKKKNLSGTLTEKQYQNHTLIFVKLYGIVLLTQKKSPPQNISLQSKGLSCTHHC